MSQEKKERKRSINWDEDEKRLLRVLIKEKISIIENKNANKNTNHLKKEAWEYISNRFNLLNRRNRVKDEIMSQWKNLKIYAKKVESEYRKQLNKTGGGPKPQTPPPGVIEIMELVPKEFVIDDNKYDSDSIFKKINNTDSPANTQTIYNIDDEDMFELPISLTSSTEIENLTNIGLGNDCSTQNTKKRSWESERSKIYNVLKDLNQNSSKKPCENERLIDVLKDQTQIDPVQREDFVEIINIDHAYNSSAKKSKTQSHSRAVLPENHTLDGFKHQTENDSSSKANSSKNKKKKNPNYKVNLQKELFEVMKLERTNRIKNENEEHKLKMDILELQKQVLLRSLSDDSLEQGRF